MNRSSSCGPFRPQLSSVLRGRAQAFADIMGGEGHPEILGMARFFQTNKGVIVQVEVCGLPKGGSAACQQRIFGFHIHEGTDCGSAGEPFSDAMSHYDPNDCEHPHHAGDLPPLFGNDGFALSAFLTNRFSVEEVIGRVIIIHDHPDDFTTIPSGNSGTKIACGVIQRARASCQ